MRTERVTDTGHRQIDHTADLALELWAPTEVELLLEVARAVVSIMTEDATISAREERAVTIESIDADDRLVQWINEIIFQGATQGFLCVGAELERGTDGLSATLRGQPDSANEIRGELKSATYHDLVLEQRDSQWRAFVVIDV